MYATLLVSCAVCFFSQVIGVAVIFALLLKPVAVDESEEVEQVLLGKKNLFCSLCAARTGQCKALSIYCDVMFLLNNFFIFTKKYPFFLFYKYFYNIL